MVMSIDNSKFKNDSGSRLKIFSDIFKKNDLKHVLYDLNFVKIFLYLCLKRMTRFFFCGFFSQNVAKL